MEGGGGERARRHGDRRYCAASAGGAEGEASALLGRCTRQRPTASTESMAEAEVLDVSPAVRVAGEDETGRE